jgi:DNA ligase (NAD+)
MVKNLEKEINLLNEEIVKLRKKLIKATNAYQLSNQMLMGDKEYDKKERQLIMKITEINIKIKEFNKTAPARRPFVEEWEKIKVKTEIDNDRKKKGAKELSTDTDFLGTLSKQNTAEDISAWMKEKWDSLKGDIIFMYSKKYDGNSCYTEHDDKGNFITGYTRGEGGYGLNVSPLLKSLYLPITLNKGDVIRVRWEIIMTDDMLNELNKSGKSYVNNRSAVSGTMGKLTAKKIDEEEMKKAFYYLSFVPLEIKINDETIPREKQLEYIDKIGAARQKNIRPFFYEKLCELDFLAGLEEQTERMINILNIYNNGLRFQDDIMVDGLVVEIYNNNKRKMTSDFRTALKFQYLTKISKIEDVEFYIGSTGRVTPVAIFLPVEFFGAIQTNVSIANYKRFQELQLAKGDKVEIQYRNDTLSYLNRVTKKSVNPPINFLEKCPLCDSDISLNESGELAFCSNSKCPSKKIGKIETWCRKIGIKGISTLMIEKLYNKGIMKSIYSLYKRGFYKRMKKAPGFGVKSAKKLKEAVFSQTEKYDYEILGSLSWPQTSRETMKLIFKKYDLYKLFELRATKKKSKFIEKLKKIEGIGDIIAENVYNYLEKDKKLINKLLEKITLKETKKEFKMIADSKKFVITGELVGYKREEVKLLLEKKGHKVISAVSKQTDYLVTNSLEQTEKYKRAKTLGIPIINEEELVSKFLK